MAMIRPMGALGPLVDTSTPGPWAPETYRAASIPYAPGVTQADVPMPPVATSGAPDSSPWLLLGGLGLIGYLVWK